jgi:dTDP-D-glucose 4,6-dehydratase
MHILVTGAAGFIGSNFVRMVAQGFFPQISQVTVLDKLTYAGNILNLDQAKNMSGYTFIMGDICDSNLVKGLIENVDAVINFAFKKMNIAYLQATVHSENIVSLSVLKKNGFYSLITQFKMNGSL